MGDSGGDLTRLLIQWGEGDTDALESLVPLVYDELRQIASRHLRSERDDHTLNTTALVHEAYERLVDQSRVEWQNRAHFFAIASTAMRRILLMYARSRNRQKRGGGVRPVELDEALVLTDATAEILIELDDALSKLERVDERMVKVVECRYFGGLTIEESAAALSVSPATVKREWRAARAWLHSVMNDAQ